MDDLAYSATLALASFTLIAAVSMALLGARGRHQQAAEAARWLALAIRAAVVALALVLASMTLHWIFGHRPGSPGELGVVAFFREHPAFVVITVLGVTVGSSSIFQLRRS